MVRSMRSYHLRPGKSYQLKVNVELAYTGNVWVPLALAISAGLDQIVQLYPTVLMSVDAERMACVFLAAYANVTSDGLV